MESQRARYAAWSALAYALLTLVALVALVLFFTLEAAQASRDAAQGTLGFYFFGFLSDLLPALASAALLVLAVAWDREAPAAARAWSRFGVACCAVAALINLAAFIGIASHRMTVPQQAVLVLVAVLPFGSWMLIASRLAGNAGTIPSKVATFGIVCGAVLVTGGLAFLLLGGLGWYSAPSFDAMFGSLPLAIAALVVYLFQLASPFWALLVWRALQARVVRSAATASSF